MAEAPAVHGTLFIGGRWETPAGTDTKDDFPISMWELSAGEKRVLPSFYGGDTVTRTYARIAELVRTGRLDLERLITHRLPLTGINEALGLMRSGEALRIALTV
ncbi:hypothetical protein ACFC6L_28500 [Kitasatospora phosalacinea]|uniref:hypothetical protein n=1 Tax=Kitasatospora phosalacinea TaxID=2065 RepID=UPI0035DC1841